MFQRPLLSLLKLEPGTLRKFFSRLNKPRENVRCPLGDSNWDLDEGKLFVSQADLILYVKLSIQVVGLDGRTSSTVSPSLPRITWEFFGAPFQINWIETWTTD